MARLGQFGCGFQNGTETMLHTTSKALELLTAASIACGSSESDAKNAYCSIFRTAIQEGLAELAPELLPLFDFTYGPDAHARAFFFGGGVRPCGLLRPSKRGTPG